MALITITGRLVRDAVFKMGDLENPYVLLHLAEPVPHKQASLLTDKANASFEPQPFVYSIFINDPKLMMITMDLKTGEPLQITGRAILTTHTYEGGYDRIVLKNIQATELAFAPFTGKRFEAERKITNE